MGVNELLKVVVSLLACSSILAGPESTIQTDHPYFLSRWHMHHETMLTVREPATCAASAAINSFTPLSKWPCSRITRT